MKIRVASPVSVPIHIGAKEIPQSIPHRKLEEKNVCILNQIKNATLNLSNISFLMAYVDYILFRGLVFQN